MAIDIHKLISAISPDVYCSNRFLEKHEKESYREKTVRDKVKNMIKAEFKKIKKRVDGKKSRGEKIEPEDIYLKAAKEAEPVESSYMEIIETGLTRGIIEKEGIANPTEKHEFSYDTFSQNLEPIYFWLIDYINDEYGGTEKLIDNFLASAGSGHFAEMQGRATKMQEEAMKIFATANTVLRSILNIIYDLKEMKTLLSQYDDYNSKDKKIRQTALLSLKQRWLDRVDIQRAGSSIKQLAVSGANQPNFVTLIDAFMVANSVKEIEDLDLNDRVKRLLLQRIPEFLKWVEQSESELRKRFEIEKIYLRSQANSLKLYARWIKPYLKAASQLEQRAEENSGLINTFNSVLLELTIIGKAKYNPLGDVATGALPEYFKRLKLRKYIPFIVVEFKFRSSPDRTDQRGGYGFRGKADIVFTSYALNEDELKILKEQLEKDDLGDVLTLIEGATTESLEKIQKDIDEFLEEKKPEEEKEEKFQDTNPFTALFSFLKPAGKKGEEKSKEIRPDSSEEEMVRSQAILLSRFRCRKLYTDFKKSFDMPALPPVV